MTRAHMNVKRLLTLAALMVLGTAFSVKADALTYTDTQVYYVGTDSTYNPFGLTNSIGNSISILNMTSAGAAGTLIFNTSGNPGVSLVSNTPGLFNVQLFGNTSGMISGGQLVAGTYTFNSTQDTFTINGYTNTGSIRSMALPSTLLRTVSSRCHRLPLSLPLSRLRTLLPLLALRKSIQAQACLRSL